MLLQSNVFSSVKLYGERLAVVEIEDDDIVMGESMLVPDTALKIHRFVRVVAKGDGRWKGSTLADRSIPDVDVGDIIMVQINPQMVNIHTVGSKTMIVMHWGDALAKVTDASQKLSTRNVRPVGKWVFADIQIATKADNIFLPDDSSAGEVTTRLVSCGALSEMTHLAPETKLYLDVSKVSHFNLGDTDELVMDGAVEPGYIIGSTTKRRKLVYVSCDYVIGTIED